MAGLALAGFADAAVIPSVELTIGGTNYNLSGSLVQGTDNKGNSVWTIAGLNLAGAGWSLSNGDFTLDSDPLLTSSGTLNNTTGAALPFSFSFSTPVAAGMYDTPTSTLGVTISSGTSGTHTTTVLMTNTVNGGTPTGADIGPNGCPVTSSGSLVTNTCSFNATGSFSGVVTDMETVISGSAAAFTADGFSGALNVNQSQTTGTPEPASIGLMIGGLLVIVSRRRKSRN